MSTHVRVFDPAMCCSSGVCGPSVDPDLARMVGMVAGLALLTAGCGSAKLKDSKVAVLAAGVDSSKPMALSMFLLPGTNDCISQLGKDLQANIDGQAFQVDALGGYAPSTSTAAAMPISAPL